MPTLRILYLEDSSYDAEMALRIIRKAGIDFSVKIVDNQRDFKTQLSEFHPDIVLSDHALYQFTSLDAIKIFKESCLKIPFVLVTGTVSEEFAVTILKEGADDYLLKDNLTRLPSAIQNSIEKCRLEHERKKYLENVIASATMMRSAESLAHFGSWEVDVATGAVKWSDEMFHIYGYVPGEIEPTYETFITHIHPDEVTAVKQMVEEILAHLKGGQCEFRIFDKGGKLKYISNKIVVSKNDLDNSVTIRGFNQDITQRKQAEEKWLNTFKELTRVEKELVEQQLGQQKIITETTIQTQEKEREELAKELHDNINQILASVKMYLNMAKTDETRRIELVDRSYDNVNYAIEEIRKLCKSLVAPSLGDIGLKEAVFELAEEVNLTRQFRVDVDFKGKRPELDPGLKLMLYRIVQEQMNNIIKYAKASKAVIKFKFDPASIRLCITDNGVGFDPSKKATGIGLKNIRARVEFYSGKLNVISAPGEGCALEIIIPV